MNERIRQLAEQAYQWAINESESGPNVCAPGSDYFLAMEKKKFAELIVRECLTFVEPMPGSGDIDDLALEAAREGIKEHFGVE